MLISSRSHARFCKWNMATWGRIFSQAGNELGTSKARTKPLQIVSGFSCFEFCEFFASFRNPKLGDLVEFFQTSENSWNYRSSNNFGEGRVFLTSFFPVPPQKLWSFSDGLVQSLNILWTGSSLAHWCFQFTDITYECWGRTAGPKVR
jgi:hypothetical protein